MARRRDNRRPMSETNIPMGAGSYVHPTAVVEPGAILKKDVKVWHFCHVRTGAVLSDNVSLAKDVYIDENIHLGEGTRIQNGVSIFRGVKLAPWVFVGPHVIFTNDMFPRAGNKNWQITETQLELGCAIGAGAIIRCGITLGAFSMIAAGAMVTRSVPEFHLALGLPARPVKMVCACGQTQLPLESPRIELLRDCCKKNLQAGLYQLAKEHIAKPARVFSDLPPKEHHQET
jgi:UDP-2-acetamido-3-amino-2,3-dideoxy-glucuronate N-acetyltransferase